MIVQVKKLFHFEYWILYCDLNRFPLKKIILLFAVTAVLVSCASNKPHKKLKPGKPIPCPTKDC